MWDLWSSRAVQRGTHESDTLVILQAFPGHGLPHIYSVNLRREIPVSLRTGGSFLGVEESGYFINGKKTLHGTNSGNICEYSRNELVLKHVARFRISFKSLMRKGNYTSLKNQAVDAANSLLCTHFLSPHSFPSAASKM